MRKEQIKSLQNKKGRRAFGREMLKGALVTGSAIVGGLAGGLVAGPAGAMIGAAGAGTWPAQHSNGTVEKKRL